VSFQLGSSPSGMIQLGTGAGINVVVVVVVDVVVVVVVVTGGVGSGVGSGIGHPLAIATAMALHSLLKGFSLQVETYKSLNLSHCDSLHFPTPRRSNKLAIAIARFRIL